MKKFTAIRIFFAALLVAVLTVSAFAEDLGVFAEDSISGERDSSVLVTGNAVGSSANINGILLAAGNDLSLSGSSEYTMAAGNTLQISGNAANDAFLAGRAIAVNGRVARDAFAASQTLTVNGSIGRDLYAAADTVTVSGVVGGDLHISADTITITDNAQVGGKLYCSGSAVVTAPQSVLDSAVIRQDAPAENSNETADITEAPAAAEKRDPVLSALVSKLFSFLGVVAVAYALLLFTPLWETVDKKYYGAPFGKYAKAFGIGFAVLAALPVAAILLIISRVGLRLSFILVLLYIAAIIAAPIFLAFFLGALVWRGAFKKEICYWAELAIGAFVWRIAACVPYLSFVVGLIAVPLGVGTAVLLLGKKRAAPAPISESGENEAE